MNDAMSEETKIYSTLPQDAETKPPSGRREKAIRAAVLAAIGSPADLVQVTVAPLWGDHVRVNVWTAGGGAAMIQDSFFLSADAGGTILGSEPSIRRRY